MRKLFILLALAGGIYSCQKETIKNPIDVIENGVQTKMRVSLVLPKTYATAEDTNASTEELAIKTVDLFIYSDNNVFLKRAHLTLSDFNLAGEGPNYNYNGVTEIATTTGPKKFYAGVNLPSSLVTAIENQGPSAAQALGVISEVTASDGFAMFSEVAVSKTLTTDVALNVVPISVKRLVAKISVVEAASVVNMVAGGVMSSMEFTVNNANSLYFPLQFTEGMTIKDPNWASTPNGELYKDANYIPASGTGVENRNLAKKYVLENTTQGTASSAYQDESTFASVRLTFKPSQIIVYKNGTDESMGFDTYDNSVEPVSTFYTLADNVGKTIYTTDLDVMQDYAANKGLNAGDIKTYTNGYVYYHTYINKANKFNVFRNDFYKINVTKLIGLGNPTEHTGDHTEIATETNMTVNIEILNWNLVEENAELGA